MHPFLHGFKHINSNLVLFLRENKYKLPVKNNPRFGISSTLLQNHDPFFLHFKVTQKTSFFLLPARKFNRKSYGITPEYPTHHTLLGLGLGLGLGLRLGLGFRVRD